MILTQENLVIKKDLTGKRYGRLLVVGLSHKDSRAKAYWDVMCDCGETKKVAGYNLGLNVNSCGCLQRESRLEHSTTHGKRRTKTYTIWAGMLQRCSNPNFTFYPRYGGRGITVCDTWKEFQSFLNDMGEVPEGMTLERQNNELGYCKENCVWASKQDQARNRSSNRLIEYAGELLPLVVWSERLGIAYKVLHTRLNKHGWTIERAFTTPVRPH